MPPYVAEVSVNSEIVVDVPMASFTTAVKILHRGADLFRLSGTEVGRTRPKKHID